jgi:hypothetical protein
MDLYSEYYIGEDHTSDPVTPFPVSDIGVGSLWWERLAVATRGSAVQELERYINFDNIYGFNTASSMISQRLLF